jgi:hypothetical protein
MRKDASVLTAVALGLVACATPTPGFLTADQLRHLMAGKTIEAVRQDGTDFRVYFDPDGRRFALQPQGEYALPWRILPDGTQCVTTGTGDDCARVTRNFDGTYSRMRDGQAVTRWLKISAGKHLGTLAQAACTRQARSTQEPSCAP